MMVCLFVMCATIGCSFQYRHGGADGAYCTGDGEINGRVAVPFAMMVAMAGLCGVFMTPVSSPVNTLVLGPGNYRL